MYPTWRENAFGQFFGTLIRIGRLNSKRVVNLSKSGCHFRKVKVELHSISKWVVRVA